MKTRILAALTALIVAVTLQPARAAQTQSAVSTELNQLIQEVQTKLKSGQRTEADLQPELKKFDDLLAKYKDQKTEDVARILSMKAALYADILHNDAAAQKTTAQLYKDFPDSEVTKHAKAAAEAKKLRASLKPGAVFPPFSVKDVSGKPLSLASYQGKIVLVDFWATWCMPCVGELPNVIKTYDEYHAKGFEVVGISLDGDEKKLTNFLKEKKMEWPQYFDGKGWKNELAGKYGIQSIPATFLLDREGKIIATDLRGEKLEAAVKQALGN